MIDVFLTQSEWLGIACIVLCVVAAYFLGNISPAILIGRLHGIDIKKEGSGNAGTTNVLRVLGKRAAAETLVVDIFKGVVAVWLGRLCGTYFLPNPSWLAGACCVAVFVGHIWPALFAFRGGKGIATGFGAIVTLQWQVGVGLAIVALVGLLISKRISVGSILAALSAPVFAFLFAPNYLPALSIMTLIALWKHRSNIDRLLKGQEPKVNFKK